MQAFFGYYSTCTLSSIHMIDLNGPSPPPLGAHFLLRLHMLCIFAASPLKLPTHAQQALACTLLLLLLRLLLAPICPCAQVVIVQQVQACCFCLMGPWLTNNAHA